MNFQNVSLILKVVKIFHTQSPGPTIYNSLQTKKYYRHNNAV